jgi:hypothetical protein
VLQTSLRLFTRFHRGLWPAYLTPGAFGDAGRIADADLTGDSGSGAVFNLLREQVVVVDGGGLSLVVVVLWLLLGLKTSSWHCRFGGGVPAASSVMGCVRTPSGGWFMRCLAK